MTAFDERKRPAVVFEAPSGISCILIEFYLLRGFDVYVVEPFHSFVFADEKIPFFPPHLPACVHRLIRSGRIRMIPSEAMDSRNAYLAACRTAVDGVEAAFPTLRREIGSLVRCLTRLMGSTEAESAFRKYFCRELARFVATDRLLEGIDQRFSGRDCIVYPHMNVSAYLEMKRWVNRGGARTHQSGGPSLPWIRRIGDGLGRFFKGAGCRLLLVGQWLGAVFRDFVCSEPSPGKKKRFRFAFTVVSPARQLSGTGRGPFFLMKEGVSGGVTAIPLVPLTKGQKRTLSEFNMAVCRLPGLVGFFRDPSAWRATLRTSLRVPWQVSGPVLVAARCLIEYQRWKELLQGVRLDHFVTHSNFGIGAIARNIALKQSGCRTWYFLDSVNAVLNYQKSSTVPRAGHPNLPYLNYDDLVVWNQYIGDFYMSHPGPPKRCHVVGSLWAGIETGESGVPESIRNHLDRARQEGLFVIGAFDSTYTRNGFTSYQEGIAFLDDLFRLLKDDSGIFLVLKEKKDRSIHRRLDPEYGPLLLTRIKAFEHHPRALTVGATQNTDFVKSQVDLVVSFPFTSTTNEALSLNRPALWHDAQGRYRETFWGRVGGLVTHDYAELNRYVHHQIGSRHRGGPTVLPETASLVDPYQDGKAIERFRSLLFGEAA